MSISVQQLLQILPSAGPQAGVFVSGLNTAMLKNNINTPARIAAFVAQAGHESAHLTRMVENLNYSAQALIATWPKHFNLVSAAAVARQPENIANIAYASRMGNGAADTGDGWKYRGRGLIQVTGRENYQECGNALGLDLLGSPELLEQPMYAALSAGWYWSLKGLNVAADCGSIDNISLAINGGTNGQCERRVLYERALQVLV